MRMSMLGLGRSVGTPPEGIEAEVVVVDSLAALRAAGNATLFGKIVLVDIAWSSYGESAAVRLNGAIEAEKFGKHCR